MMKYRYVLWHIAGRDIDGKILFDSNGKMSLWLTLWGLNDNNENWKWATFYLGVLYDENIILKLKCSNDNDDNGTHSEKDYTREAKQ